MPNGLGAVLGFIQILLRIFIPNREVVESSETHDVDVEATVPSASTAEEREETSTI